MRVRSSHRGKHFQRGFTLMEVLLVLAILVIIGGAATIFISGMQESAYEKAAFDQIQSVKTALASYKLNVGRYPASLDDLVTQPADLPNPKKWKQVMEMPLPADPWDNPYNYEVSGNQYRVWSLGPDGADNTEDDIASDLPPP